MITIITLADHSMLYEGSLQSKMGGPVAIVNLIQAPGQGENFTYYSPLVSQHLMLLSRTLELEIY